MGVRTILRTQEEITISKRMAPFLTEPWNGADCIITVQSTAILPAFSQKGKWYGMEYYDWCEDLVRVFHCEKPMGAAFAVTQLHENGNVDILVLPEYRSYFTGTAGIFNRIGIESLLLQHRGLLLHASLIKYMGKAVAFTGPSGIGKSTQAELWKTYLGAEILNGDRACVKRGEEGWMAYGSPYAGTSGIYRNDKASLAAIVVLRHGRENRLYKLTKSEAFRYLYPELSIHHWDESFLTRATDLCLELLEEVPAYMLECLPEEGAVQIVKKGLEL